jgi:transcriptional regulator GlxA family with amidase domain
MLTPATIAKIRELMVDHTLNMKEIADLAGMKNVTHLHKFIQTQCGMTPKQLRRTLGR